MGAKVELIYGDDTVDSINCNFAKVRDGCVIIAHQAGKDSDKYVSDYIPLVRLKQIRIITDKKEDSN